MNSCLALIRDRLFRLAAAAVTAGLALCSTAHAEALLLVDAHSGKVLHAEKAAYPWYPASVTKLMTAYVTLRAVRERRVSLDQAVTVSANAAAQAPSKMGFKPGTQVTVDNALKMLMVKSANDMAVVLAEGVSGSVEDFATEMNRAAQRLGMTQTSYVNPNGLPADGQVTSARDLAILARALIHELPEYDSYWHIPAIKFGKRLMRNYNTLIDRYPGADGMKTGFICASGFNLVATASRNGKRFIAVVLGARSSAQRAEKAAQLLEKGFSGAGGLSWLMPALGGVESLTPVNVDPPNMRDEMCGKHRRRPAAESSDEEDTENGADGSIWTLLNPGLEKSGKGATLIGPLVTSSAPVTVYVGPSRNPTALARAPKGSTYETAGVGNSAPPAAEGPVNTPTLGLGEIARILPSSRFLPARALALTSAAEAAGAPIVRPEATAIVPVPRARPKIAARGEVTPAKPVPATVSAAPAAEPRSPGGVSTKPVAARSATPPAKPAVRNARSKAAPAKPAAVAPAQKPEPASSNPLSALIESFRSSPAPVQ